MGSRATSWRRSGSTTTARRQIAKKLIDVASLAGCEAVKFQKRTVDVVYTAEELAKPRESPFGETNGDLKRALELGQAEYEEIDAYCRAKSMDWTASGWDEASVDFIDQFDPPFYKIASASLTDDELLSHTRKKGKPIVLSTGGSTLDQIDHAVEVLGKEDLILLHCCSAYPSQYAELNLRAIPVLRERYGVPIGYSGHETGIASSVAAATLGACIVERHVTMDRSLWGSDQAASSSRTGSCASSGTSGSWRRQWGTASRPCIPPKSQSCRSSGGSGSERENQGHRDGRRWRPHRRHGLAQRRRYREQAGLLRGHHGRVTWSARGPVVRVRVGRERPNARSDCLEVRR